MPRSGRAAAQPPVTMADDIPVDLFGDDDEDEDEEGEGFGYAEEDFVEVGADTPLAAEVTHLKRPIWLAKVRRPQLRRTAQGGPQS